MVGIMRSGQSERGGNVIIVGGTFEVEPDQREEFIASRHDLMRASRAEAGCLEYTFSADPIEPHRVLLFERWESQSDLDAHLSGVGAGPKPSSDDVTPTSISLAFYDATDQSQRRA
jgi:quinol monooxygenase YgiN